APFVGEDHRGAAVVEGGRVPVREVGVGNGVDTARLDRIRNIEQQSVSLTGSAGKADFRVQGDVVALVRSATLCSTAAAATLGHHGVDHALQTRTQCCRVGRIRGFGAALFGDFSQEAAY